MHIDLSGLNILVTGSSRGIGKAIAVQLAEAGATIALHYHRKEPEARHLARELGNNSECFQADFSNPAEAARLFDRVVHKLGYLDVVVNNAGVALAAQNDWPDEQWMQNWDRHLSVNLSAAAIIGKKAIQHFIERRSGGRLIQIASRAAFRGEEAEFLAYAASKAGLVALSRSIARSYGKQGIKSFMVAPGFVRTDMSRDFMEKYGEGHATDDIVLERLTEPADIAPTIAFLASGMADHATGSTFDINAGSYLH